MHTATLEAALALPISERIRLVEAIWDSVAEDSAGVPLPAWQAEELDRRLARFDEESKSALTWPEVKGRVAPVK